LQKANILEEPGNKLESERLLAIYADEPLFTKIGDVAPQLLKPSNPLSSKKNVGKAKSYFGL
jgi:hypothetical protein